MLRLALTDACHLRLFEESDVDEFHALIEANRAHLSPWMPWVGQPREETLAFIRSTRRQIADNDGLQTVIVCDGRLAGAVGFHGVDWKSRATSIGYWLAEPHQGKGIMTRAVRALVEHAFSAWQLNRVEIQVAPENRRSRAIPERLGFREEGTRRAAELVGERYLDSVVYGMLAAEWKAD